MAPIEARALLKRENDKNYLNISNQKERFFLQIFHIAKVQNGINSILTLSWLWPILTVFAHSLKLDQTPIELASGQVQ